MHIGIIGAGAIGNYVHRHALERGYQLDAVLVRPQSISAHEKHFPGTVCIGDVTDIPNTIDTVIDCAGHTALRAYGPTILRSGTDLITVSLGALADSTLYDNLKQAAIEGSAKLHLASGAIGALDCLRSARIGQLHGVTYTGRKPPKSWAGSPAETRVDLTTLTQAMIHFDGCARDAATQYPKNANVAAAVALAGVGFERTQVQLIADPNVSENIHEVRASGEFGTFYFEVRGNSLADNPKSSALAAMSVVSTLEQQSQPIVF